MKSQIMLSIYIYIYLGTKLTANQTATQSPNNTNVASILINNYLPCIVQFVCRYQVNPLLSPVLRLPTFHNLPSLQ